MKNGSSAGAGVNHKAQTMRCIESSGSQQTVRRGSVAADVEVRIGDCCDSVISDRIMLLSSVDVGGILFVAWRN